ncbi:MAG: histidine--tRNA ligase [Bacteroidia bacterium]
MAIQKPSIPKGTRDFGPEEVAKRKYILNTIEKVFIKYGFMPIETPTMENLTTLQGKYGDEGDQLLFKVLNSGDYLKELKEENDKGLAHEERDKTFLPSYSGKLSDLDHKAATPFISEKGLRYDLTVPFARYVVMHQNEITFPFRRYQMQPVWRADRPQKGRYREFWQCDADVVGSDSLLNEVDLTNIYLEVFKQLNIKVKVKINHRKILEGMAEYFNCLNRFNEFVPIIDKIDKIGYAGVITELEKNGFTNDQNRQHFDKVELSYFSEGIQQNYKKWEEQLDRLEDLFSRINPTSIIGKEGVEELRNVLKYFKPNEDSIEIYGNLARGLSYYTGTVWEVVVENNGALQSSIGGGGRYDNLTGIFGLPNVSGVGISFGVDRIYDVMEELKLFPPTLNQFTTKILFCCFDDKAINFALPLLKKVRDAGIASEIYPAAVKMKKQLDYANDKKIPFACIIGDNEMQSGKLVLKDLNSGIQVEKTIEEIINEIKK